MTNCKRRLDAAKSIWTRTRLRTASGWRFISNGWNQDEKAQAAILIAQARVVIVLRAIALCVALWLGYRDGLPGLAFGLGLRWFLGLAKPEPPAELTKKLDK